MAKKPNDQDPGWIAHKKRTAAIQFDETAFTEDFLARFSDEDAVAARRFGQMIKDATLELYGAYPNSPREEPFTQAGLKAVVADLRKLEHRLADLSKNEEYLKEPEELRLCRLASRKAFAVARIADGIERAFRPVPQTPKSSDNE